MQSPFFKKKAKASADLFDSANNDQAVSITSQKIKDQPVAQPSDQPGDQVQIVLEPCDKAKSFRKIMSLRPLENGRIVDIKAYNA